MGRLEHHRGTNNNCCVYGCLNKQKNSTLSFFTLPKDSARRNEWLKEIERSDLLNKTDIKSNCYRVCSMHFDSSVMSELLTRKLLPSAVPTKFLPNQPQASTSKCENESRINSDTSTQTKHSNIISVVTIKNASTESHRYLSKNKEECSPTPGTSERQSRKRNHPSASEHGEDEDSVAEEGTHYTSDKESQNGKLRVSSDILIPESTNVTLDQELLMDLHELSDKIQNFYPVLAGRQFTLCFKGEDGDKCEYIFTSASELRRNGEHHSGLRCDECKADIIGSRYKCVTCRDYDLCSACEALGIHAQHIMMRITKPLKFKQAREMVKRCCDVMKAGDIAAVDEIVGSTSAGDPDNSAAQENIVEASTSKEAVSVNDPVHKPKTAREPKSKVISTRHCTKPLVVKSAGSPKVKASTTTGGADDKQKKTNEDRKRKAEASEDEEEKSPGVKEKPEDWDLTSYYNSFTDMEPTLAIEDVKIEDPDPLETGGEESDDSTSNSSSTDFSDCDNISTPTDTTVNFAQPTSAGLSSWNADNSTDPGGAAGSSGASKSQEDTSSVCITYTHKRTKH